MEIEVCFIEHHTRSIFPEGGISDIEFEARATDATYTFSYLALFDSKEDKENYLHHPLHTKFVEDFGPSKGMISKVVIYDSLRIPD